MFLTCFCINTSKKNVRDINKFIFNHSTISNLSKKTKIKWIKKNLKDFDLFIFIVKK
jgi:hypothetical protein